MNITLLKYLFHMVMVDNDIAKAYGGGMKENTYTSITKDQAINTLATRIQAKFPSVDVAKERAILDKRSRASLLHSVGSQWYGDLTQVDRALCAYAYGEMTPEEKREIDQAG